MTGWVALRESRWSGREPWAASSPRSWPPVVLPAVVYCGVERTAPGRVVHRTHGYFHVPGGEPARDLAALFPPEREMVQPGADWPSTAWRKLCENVTANGVTALTGRRIEVLRGPAIQELLRGLLAEATAVAAAERAALPPDFADLQIARMTVGGRGSTRTRGGRGRPRAARRRWPGPRAGRRRGASVRPPATDTPAMPAHHDHRLRHPPHGIAASAASADYGRTP